MNVFLLSMNEFKKIGSKKGKTKQATFRGIDVGWKKKHSRWTQTRHADDTSNPQIKTGLYPGTWYIR